MPSSTSTSTPSIAASPRTPTNIHSTAVVSSKATITGTHLISIGANSIINPFATIDSTHGPVEIGEGVVVWERVVIGTSGGDDSSNASEQDAVHEPLLTKLGNNVVIEAHNTIPCGAQLEEGVHVCMRAHIGQGARVGAFAKLTSGVKIAPGDEVPPYSVVFFACGEERQMMRVNRSLVENEKMRQLQRRGHEKLLESLRLLVK